MFYLTSAAGTLSGSIRVASDKSQSHRAVILSSIAEGQSVLRHVLLGEDNMSTLKIMQQLGVQINIDGSTLCVSGVGLHGLQESPVPLNCGNSGTAIRLLAGLLSAQRFSSELVGDASLSTRPMRRVIDPLTQMGAVISGTLDDTPPLCIEGNQTLKGISYKTPMVSAQVKSCVLLAGLYASGETTVIEPGISRDHTERMLTAFGCELRVNDQSVSIRGGQRLQSCDLTIPGDISSAAFFMVAATIVPNSEILLKSIGINPTRRGVIDILRLMGADITLENVRDYGCEPVADIRVRYAKLKGIEIPPELVPLAIDECPVLMIAASVASGETLLTEASELRVKETDRIAAMAHGLSQLGISVEVFEDGMRLQGGQLQGGEVNSFGDHRIAMSFAIAGCVSLAPITVQDCACVATSFPDFLFLSEQLGIHIKEKL